MKTPFLSLRRVPTWLKSPAKALLPAALLLGLAHNAQAQFPRNETFKNASAPNFTLINARLTGTGSGLAGDDAVGSGYLQLTNAANDKAGSVIDNIGFDAPAGFTISFEFFAYGGSGADGFSVFLVDQAQPITGFQIGASGGSLGYAQKTSTPISPGVTRGYIGIGIDEFGNFANPTEGRNGGPGFTPDAVSIRGAGEGLTANPTDYPYLTGTALNQLGFSIDVPTVRAQSGSGDYRRAFIDVVPTGTGATRTYKITVRIQHGSEVTSTVTNFTVATPPDRLRLGFSGSTGGQTNFHEIRNLNIVQAPFANDDIAATRYDQPVTINAISNDIFPGTGFQTGSLDLDFGTAGIQNFFVVSGKGRFDVTPSGQVTFTPLITFAGTVVVPYTVNDVLGQTTSTSSPANITIIVQGADVATSVSGPTSANPGSTITYAVTTSNLGPVTAENVAVKLQLTPNLPAGSVTTTSGTYDAGTGVVTFTPIASLASGATPIVNSVTFTVPASGSIVGTATSTNTIPDPVTANNTATITTTISGVANVGTSCATPGRDGVGTLDATIAPNTYYPGVSVAPAGGTSTITVGPAATGAGTAATPVAAGDLVLVMQMQGADITTTNTAAYGTVTANTNYTAGRYEYAIVRSVAAGTGSNQVLTLVKTLTNVYSNAATGGQGQRRFQVLRVPQYSSVTLSGTVSGAAWNSATGGVLAIDVAGRTSYAAGAQLSMTGKGFRGGGGSSSATAITTAYASNSGAGNGSKGEGTTGTPIRVYDGTSISNPTGGGYPTGSHAAGAPGNAGGGATDAATNNTGNAGGGGGTNGGNGGIGGFGFTNTGGTGSGIQALGGRDISAEATASRLFMGGGGGAGSTSVAPALASSGGVGGGIIILRSGPIAPTTTGTLLVQATGSNAPTAGNAVTTITNLQGAGGGGAGGTVLVMATAPDGTAAALTNVAVNVNGGVGGNAGYTDNGRSGNPRVLGGYGPGGGGGGGKYYTNGALSTTTTSTVAGGSAGTTQNGTGNGAGTSSYGAAAGTAGVASPATPASGAPIIAGAGGCLPMLTVGLRTSTPTRTRVGEPGSAVNPALYELTVSNTGGEASDLQVLANLPANIFNFDNSFAPQVVLTLADNTVGTPVGFAVISQGSTPTFSLASLPAGARLSITFQATIVATANDGFAYQANGTVSYTNPLRTTAGATIQPGGNYAGGTDVTSGTAGGSNYTGTNPGNTFEDVTITRPLPVELKRFEATAVGLNAELSWATASELQNDHFDIERSLDGRSFERIGEVKGQGTTSRETAYRYTDTGAGRLSLKPIYYRLRQVDRDGPGSFSPVRVVRFERGAKAAIALYPNPHQGTATLDLTALAATDYSVEIMDLAGRRVRQFQLAGGLQHPLDLNALPLGSYLVRVHSAATVITLPMIRN